MEWKLFFLTFGSVFLAEMGDKTQLATLLYSTQSKKPLMIFAGSALALVLSSFLAVVVGQFMAEHLPHRLIKGLAALSFIVIGLWIMAGVIKNP